ncbi:hypothetical protein CYMTET_25879 [Cymbomonas tetramitiformis]|uniref:RING-type domain-containing protein n=1 Tax=Cymbomonas tetramitiformis TaxID=36881 RepID=A0AAE0FT66_9CHLO|nr:hypothetical protein CYMTET_25879 [Cymbomonas tetramitiformis]
MAEAISMDAGGAVHDRTGLRRPFVDILQNQLIDPTLDVSEQQARLHSLVNLLRNVLKYPEQEKFRKLRFSNPQLKAKVVDVRGSVEYLAAAGWQHKVIDAEEHLLLPLDSSATQLRFTQLRVIRVAEDVLSEYWKHLTERAEAMNGASSGARTTAASDSGSLPGTAYRAEEAVMADPARLVDPASSQAPEQDVLPNQDIDAANNESDPCPICLEEVEDKTGGEPAVAVVRLGCGHQLHLSCWLKCSLPATTGGSGLDRYVEARVARKCALCRVEYDQSTMETVRVLRQQLAMASSSIVQSADQLLQRVTDNPNLQPTVEDVRDFESAQEMPLDIGDIYSALVRPVYISGSQHTRLKPHRLDNALRCAAIPRSRVSCAANQKLWPAFRKPSIRCIEEPHRR